MSDPSEGTPLGPLEYIVVHFAGSHFTGEIAPALADLVDQGLVRVIDLAVVSKAHDGAVDILEIQELSPEVAAAFVKLDGAVRGLLSEADLDDRTRAVLATPKTANHHEAHREPVAVDPATR